MSYDIMHLSLTISTFSKLRDLETAFHDRMLTVVMQEMAKFSKNELEHELPEEMKAILADKEALTNVVNASHDSQIMHIESREDDITKFEARFLEQTVNGVKANENARNSYRVAEIFTYVDVLRQTIQSAMEGNYNNL
ncbi:leucine-rich repeat-containing protein 48-like [Planoprotostelium fungivorum]|uniref:Leucine-rich repeat-containing protein 48-like n=1 Tax=Planoprotostelium fungivorum TaxID=1890364 RepID=A0A2P6NCV1_9EUKA|nr:leucine-rich repeat-containing protein 48-like [Planoprotostelium fungivorum]PRP84173.1 leucine-rich repeat-containing protein 48-like [Planoprotostelium fungivorum]